MTVANGQVVCPSNVGTLIVAAANSNTVYATRGSPRVVQLSNPSAQGIYVGGDATVSSTTGYLLGTNGTLTLTLYATDALYGRGASASPTISYLVTGT